MFGFFKTKTKKEKLTDLYYKKKEQAFKLSKTNRKQSDKLEKEANDILTEIDNDGSRAISDISLIIRFINSDNIEIDRTYFNKSSLPAHSSVSGDSLELIVIGPSVWEDYTIDIDLEYTKNNKDNSKIELEYVVGEWKMEQFSHGTGIDFF